jgi:hypothetical protein
MLLVLVIMYGLALWPPSPNGSEWWMIHLWAGIWVGSTAFAFVAVNIYERVKLAFVRWSQW